MLDPMDGSGSVEAALGRALERERVLKARVALLDAAPKRALEHVVAVRRVSVSLIALFSSIPVILWLEKDGRPVEGAFMLGMMTSFVLLFVCGTIYVSAVQAMAILEANPAQPSSHPSP